MSITDPFLLHFSVLFHADSGFAFDGRHLGLPRLCGLSCRHILDQRLRHGPGHRRPRVTGRHRRRHRRRHRVSHHRRPRSRRRRRRLRPRRSHRRLFKLDRDL